jgi:VanZ family protein
LVVEELDAPAGAGSRAGSAARLLLLAALLLFLALGDAPDRTRFWSAFFEAGHTPLFGLIALLVRSLLARHTRIATFTRLSLVAFGVTLLVGATTEVLQLLQSNHDASVHDFLRDAAGAGAFLLVEVALVSATRPGIAGWGRRARLAALAAAAVLLLAAGWELIGTARLYFARDRAVPTLFALDGSWWERELIALGNNRLIPDQVPVGPQLSRTARFARLDLMPGIYSGLTFDEPYPDWHGYRQLTLTIVSDLAVPLPMTIRIHDAAHDQRYADRFNRRLLVNPGTNRFVIAIDDIRTAPDRRVMDLRHVRGIVLFAYKLEQPTHVYLGPLRLE